MIHKHQLLRSPLALIFWERLFQFILLLFSKKFTLLLVCFEAERVVVPPLCGVYVLPFTRQQLAHTALYLQQEKYAGESMASLSLFNMPLLASLCYSCLRIRSVCTVDHLDTRILPPSAIHELSLKTWEKMYSSLWFCICARDRRHRSLYLPRIIYHQ